MHNPHNYYLLLAESFLKDAGKAPEIPRCFYQVGTMQQAWESVFESREQLERTAEKIRKLRITTCITRKDFKHGSPELVLAATMGQHDYLRQLRAQVSPEQAHALLPARLVESYLPELIGPERIASYQHLIDTKCHATIQAEILKRFPFASEIFSFGWGIDEIYYVLICLPDLLSIIEKEHGKRFYQATLAAHVFLCDCLGARLPDWLMEGGYRVATEQLTGVMFHWARLVKHHADSGISTIPSVVTLSAGLMRITAQVGQRTAASTFEIMSTLHGMFTEHSVSFTQMATEHVNLILIPELVKSSKRIEDLKAKLNLASLGNECRPISPRKASFPKPEDGVLSTQRIRVLAQLWRDFKHEADLSQAAKHIDEAERLIANYTKSRDRLARATQKADLDVDLIERLAKEARETKELAQTALQLAASKLVDIDEQVRAVEADWRECIAGAKKKLGEQQLREQLVNSQCEAQELSRELGEAKRGLSRLKEKVRVQEGIERSTEEGAKIDTALFRKVAQKPHQLTPTEILRYTSALSEGRMRILPSAWRSAEEADKFEFPARLLNLLDVLMFDYAPAILGGQPDSAARKVFGNSYAAKESSTVETSPAMRAERTFLVDGEEVFFERHLKIGNSPNATRGMRIYFEFVDGKVVIAHCGAHLTNDSTS